MYPFKHISHSSKSNIYDFLRERLDGSLNPHKFLFQLLLASLSRLSAIRDGHPFKHVNQVFLGREQILQRRHPLFLAHESGARGDLRLLLLTSQPLHSLICFMLVFVQVVGDFPEVLVVVWGV